VAQKISASIWLRRKFKYYELSCANLASIDWVVCGTALSLSFEISLPVLEQMP
jgi:hypothetical protein